MQPILRFLPALLLAAGLPASSQSASTPSEPAQPTHRVQAIRPGKGEPRNPARSASARAADPAQDSTRTRRYQPAQPGEGAPKN